MYLHLDNVSKIFAARGGGGEVTAISKANLQIEEGEFITLLGPSGCGKTTMLRMIAGFEFPTSGKIWLDGADIGQLPPHKRGMSMVFQSYAIFPHLTVFENIAYGLRVQRVSKANMAKRVDRVLEMVELEGYGSRTPEQLSGGQQQRVALARALVMEPKVLLMDEPLSNLDAKLRDQMRTEIRRIQQQLGITSIYVTHDQTEAMTMSDRVVVMNVGEVAQVGPPLDIYRKPNSRFVADFIGRANFVKGTIKAISDGTLTVDALGRTLDVSAVSADYRVGQTATIVIRPEMAEINPATHPPHAKGIVRQSAYLGHMIEYEIEVAGQLLSLVETDPRRTVIHSPGDAVTVRFFDESLLVVPD